MSAGLSGAGFATTHCVVANTVFDFEHAVILDFYLIILKEHWYSVVLSGIWYTAVVTRKVEI